MYDLYDGNNHLRRYFETSGAFALDEMIMSAKAGDVWVFDATNSRARRKEIYPQYKEGRVKASDNFYEIMLLWKEILTHLPVVSITVPTYEADDVINALVKDTDKPVKVHSSDGDFQSIDNQLVTLTSNPIGIEPRLIRIYKTLVGDKSDNIGGIAGFGAGFFKKVSLENLEYLIEKYTAQEMPEYRLLGLSEMKTSWCVENHKLLQSYWNVIGFFPLTVADIAPHIKVGKADYYAIAEIYEKEGIITANNWAHWG